MRLSWIVVAVAAIALAPGTSLAFGDKHRCRQTTGFATTTFTVPSVVTTRTVTTGTVLMGSVLPTPNVLNTGTVLTGAWFPTPNAFTGTTFNPTTILSTGPTVTGFTSNTDTILTQLLQEQQKTNALLTTLVNRGGTMPPPNAPGNPGAGGIPAPNTAMIAGLPATMPLPVGTPRHVSAPLEFNAALVNNQPGRALDIYAWARQQTDAEAAELKKNQDAVNTMLAELQRRGIAPK